MQLAEITQQVREAIRHYNGRAEHPLQGIKAAFFDMDGVLYNSMPHHARAWHETLLKVGIETRPEEFYLYEGQTAGQTVSFLFERELGRAPLPEELVHIYKEKTARFTELNDGALIPGILEVIAELPTQRKIVVTGSSQPSLLERIKVAFAEVFREGDVISGKDVKHGKPYPEPYLMALERAGVAPWEAIVVENAPMGVRSAVAAGVFTIAVNTGIMPDKVLLDEGCDLLLPDMYHLKEAIPILLAQLV